MLKNIRSPKDIQALSDKELKALAEEIRKTITDTVSKNGGHLASNLGAVELSIALHRVFDCPEDKIIFDVGHQCYTHKLLTGRYESFLALRSLNGISGFTNRFESEYDVLTAGHSGPALSAALGVARANKLSGKNSYTVAVIGDGSFTNGMVYEALNNCSEKGLNLIIVLNDNNMSISRNVGALPRSFRRLRSTKGYFTLKAGTKKFFGSIPVIGSGIIKIIKWVKSVFKKLLVRNNLFESLGLEYIGPVNGHDEKSVELALKEAKTKSRVTVVHVSTKKGKGYHFAETAPEKYHGVGAFDPQKGILQRDEGFSECFGNTLTELAKADDKILAITAAMSDGTGLNTFKKAFPERFFDVGIAEEHAVTFAAGLSLMGYKPVVAMYSTFSQRVFDQLMHDVSLQGLPLILALDRAGIVGGDGVTHQGVFDISLFSPIPGVEIYSPETFFELKQTLLSATSDYRGIKIIRYPKGGDVPERNNTVKTRYYDYNEVENPEVAVITFGRCAKTVCTAAEASGKRVRVIKLKRVFPVNEEELLPLIAGVKKVLVVEEAVLRGGVGEMLCACLSGKGFKTEISAISGYIEHGDAISLLAENGFDEESIKEKIIRGV